ncbi:MAG: hypothetical protein B7C24_04450 [Bacteroidetes bacterium 4572_77]|nr:MAG: hypothetical protein B7C24_04450 [Bacteroidetes bacterium 4572_77]
MKNKSIDINQRIPLYVLAAALESFLNETYSNDYVLEQLRLEYEGENRLKKALRIVNRIIPRNPMIEVVLEHKESINSILKRKADRNMILIALLNTAFPFSFDVLSAFGKFFAVQDVINSDTIKKSVSNIYGGNRATENGIYSVVPMFLEAGLFDRPKSGIYQFISAMNISSPIVKELYKLSYKKNIGVDNLQDYQLIDPYFQFVD